jgi:hypothetical protein
VISAKSKDGDLRFMTYTQTMTGPLFVQFLDGLIAETKRKIYLIVDRLPAHTSGVVDAWLEKHRQQLELFYLARRAPERMPVEYLNNAMKADVNAQKLPENKAELRGNIEGFLQVLAELPERVMTLFRHTKVAYASTPV